MYRDSVAVLYAVTWGGLVRAGSPWTRLSQINVLGSGPAMTSGTAITAALG